MAIDYITLSAAKGYVGETADSLGAVKGAPATIKSITEIEGGHRVTFEWTSTSGTKQTSTLDVMNGVDGKDGADGKHGESGIGINNVKINTEGHLIVTLSDDSTIDAGLIQGGNGTDNYEDLTNRPKIEGVELIGNKTFEDLGIASATDLAQTDGQLQDLADLVGDKTNLPMPNETVIDNIEYVDTKVDGLIDDNATGLAKTFSSDKITKTFATIEEVNERIPQYEVMPTATEACGGQVIQFIGTTTSDYTHGYFYECVLQDSGYIWKNIKVQTGTNGGANIDDTNVSETTTYSSKKITDDYYTKTVVDTALGQKASTTTLMNHVGNSDIHVTSVDKSRWDAKSDFDGKYASLTGQPAIPSKTSELQNDSGYQTADNVTTTLADYALKTEIPTNVSQLTNDSNFIDNAVDTLVNYYKKSQVYTQDEINALLSNLTGKLSAKVVTELPTEDISTSTMYLIAIADQEGVYSQHMYIDNAWVMLGTTSNNFDDYYDKTQIDTKLADKADKNEIPTIPTNVSAFTNDAGYLTTHQSLDEYAKKTELPTVTNDLTNELKAQYDEAVTKEHTHDNKTVLDTLTTEKVSAYDNASTLAHEHENKTVIDKITQDNLDDYNEAVLNSHSHTNKATIDKFTEAEDGTLLFDGANVKGAQINDAVTNQTNVWSSKKISDTIALIEEKAHTHDNKAILDALTQDKISGYDSAKTHADSPHAPETAQENIIETVRINGTDLTPVDKVVDIDLSSYVGNKGVINSKTDFNTLTENAIYSVTSASFAVNAPTPPSAGILYVTNSGSLAKYIQQIYRTSTSDKLYSRVSVNSGASWSNWKELATVEDLIDDSSTATDKVWSSKKVNDSFIPMSTFDLSADIDLDDYTQTGYYSLNADTSSGAFTHSLLNFPETAKPAGGFGLDVRSYGTGSKWCTQTVYIYSSGHVDVWCRTRYYSSYKEVWGNWERLAKYSKTLSINQSFTADTWNVIDTGTKINWWAENVVAVFKSAFYSASGTQVFGVIRVNATTGNLEFRPEDSCDFVIIHVLMY